jgi:mRNA-degrading endonuclease RelE of RelBE toxin-antitoxin system
VATKSRYQVKINDQVIKKDLVQLLTYLKKDFEAICRTILTQDPYNCFGLDSHNLKGDLIHHRAIEIDDNGISYRLVYRIYEKPIPKRVVVLSFAKHDPAYDRAKERK